jgi:hypothetical protein
MDPVAIRKPRDSFLICTSESAGLPVSILGAERPCVGPAPFEEPTASTICFAEDAVCVDIVKKRIFLKSIPVGPLPGVPINWERSEFTCFSETASFVCLH